MKKPHLAAAQRSRTVQQRNAGLREAGDTSDPARTVMRVTIDKQVGRLARERAKNDRCDLGRVIEDALRIVLIKQPT